MADTRISELTTATTLTGSEVLPLVQSAATVKTTAQDIANLAPVTSVAGRTGAVTIQKSDIADFGTYLTAETSHADVVVDGDFASTGLMKRGATAGSYSIVTDNSTNWNTAYSWGNHSTAGYSTFSGSYTDLTNKPSIPSSLTDLGITDGSSGQVLTTNGAGGFTFTTVSSGGTGGIALTDLSVSVAAAGTANLAYNNTTGTFTYTPPDLSGYSTFSGSYADLTNKPTLFSGSYTDLTNKPTLFDGAYSSLSGTPTIPSALTDLGITDGSSGQVLTTNGAGAFSFTTVSGGGGGSGAAAWVTFNGTGTPSITQQSNVASITDLGVGRYQINFSSALSSANYALAGFVYDSAGGTGSKVWMIVGAGAAPSTTSAEVWTKTDDSGMEDFGRVSVIFVE